MSEKYIRENKNSFTVNKNSRIYGKFESIDDAIFARQLLIECNWDLNAIGQIHNVDERYIVTVVFDEKLYILTKQEQPPSQKTIEELTKKRIRNPNNSKYGLNITKIFDTYVIKKQIAGEGHVFGYYDTLDDAEFVRNFLMDHMWNIDEFSQIEYDEESETYKIIEVIDGRVYVIDSVGTKEEIDLDDSHQKFLTKISKHKNGLESHSYLDELKNQIPELEDRFDVEVSDDVWFLKDTKNPLNDIIFKLTPFQKSVYDSIDRSTFEDIKKSLIRFKSGNFDEKIRKNIDELEKEGLIYKDENYYMKKEP